MIERRPRPPTLQDLADATGVSRTTVSNAFNRPDQLSTELRDRVLAAAAEMGYPGPNPLARMLRTGKAGAIGLVFSEALPYAFDDPTAIAFLQGVAEVCGRTQEGLLIIPAMDQGTAQNTIRAAAVDGFIIYSLASDSDLIRHVLDRHLPVVSVDLADLPGVPSVGTDDRAGARAAARHLLDLGHRRFGVIAMELLADGYAGPVDAARRARTTYRPSLERLLGYEDALREASLDIATLPIEERPGNSEDAAHAAALALLHRSPRPTAILAMSDRLAMGALRAAEALGIAVPGELSVIGYDDIPIAARIKPALTTVRQPLVEKGAIAAQLLLENEGAGSATLDTELVTRESTAPAS